MPKRYLDVGIMDPVASEKAQRKTERSHEENQERAYIAASRRADRSIEARVQSARMASEIHKRRTGKAFRITEEIVVKEEMYEEEEDDFPRSYRLLGPHMQTSSAEMNSRVETYLTNRVAMSKLLSASEQDWRENAINRAFAQTFPNADRHAQSLNHRWSTPGYQMSPQQAPGLQSPADSSFDAHFQPVNYGTENAGNERSRSMSAVSPSDLDTDNLSPPALTPGSGSHPETPQSQPASIFSSGNVSAHNAADYGSDGSVFTAELPAEARMLMGGGMDLSFLSADVYQHDWAPENGPTYTYPDPKLVKMEDEPADVSMYMNGMSPMDWDMATQHTGADEPSWDSFINDNAWGTDQQ